MICKNCGKENFDTAEHCMCCKKKCDIQSIKENSNYTDNITSKKLEANTLDSNHENSVEDLFKLIAILPFLLIIGLIIISSIDPGYCDGSFGALDERCNFSNYFIFIFFSIPFALLSLLGKLTKKISIATFGSIFFLGVNLLLLFSAKGIIKTISIVCSIFSVIMIFIELGVLYNNKRDSK